jgi:ATP-dependent Zn protease
VMADVLAEISGRDGETLTDEFRRMLSVHEAGHAAVGLAFGHEVQWMNLNAKGGITMIKAADKVPTLATTAEEIAVMLAGIAAEQLILDTVSIPVNSPGSDLARATMEALSIETVSGQGSNGLLHIPAVHVDSLILLRNGELQQAVRARLDEAELNARQIIARHRPAVEALAEALAQDGYVGREAILAIAAENGLHPPEASQATGGAP